MDRLTASPMNAYRWMDAFRAFAAVLVAASHVRDMMWRDYLPSDPLAVKALYFMTGFGHIGVILFFTLSGFWITQAVMRRIDGPRFWSGYLVDRLSRLWIVLLPVLAIGGLADYLGAAHWAFANYSGASGMHSISAPVTTTLGVKEALGSAAFLGAIFVAPLGSNTPLWSLSYEFWYYIWFPALMLLFRKRRLSWAILLLGLGAVAPAMAYGFLSWLTGSALYFAFERTRAVPAGPRDRVLAALAFAAFIGAVVLARVVQDDWTDIVLAAVFAVFLFGLIRIDFRFPELMQPAAWFGSRSSYSLYALHFPLAMLATGWLTNGARLAPSLELAASSTAVLVGLIVVAVAFSMVTERRTNRVRHWARRHISRPVDATAQVVPDRVAP